MAVITIDVTDQSQIPAAIQSVVNDVVREISHMNFRQDIDDLNKRLERQHVAMYKAGHEADGTPWEPLAAATVRKKGHATILIEEGRLARSLAYRTTGSIRDINVKGNSITLEFGTRDENAIKHHEGSRVMPIREPVGLGDPLLNQFVEDVANNIVKRITR